MIDTACQNYIDFWQTLQPDNLDRLESVAVPDIVFTDPFRTLTGIPAVKHMLAEMFRKTKSPRFVVTGHALNGATAYLRWRFTVESGYTIEGMSEVEFAPDGRALRHIDHWDAASQVYGKIPLLGSLLRLLGRLF
jgi:steroid Delta-isomerase